MADNYFVYWSIGICNSCEPDPDDDEILLHASRERPKAEGKARG